MRKSIEQNMHRFKDFERALKTKAYSTFALAKDGDAEEDDDLNPETKKHHEWLLEQIRLLEEQVDGYECEIENRGLTKESPEVLV